MSNNNPRGRWRGRRVRDNSVDDVVVQRLLDGDHLPATPAEHAAAIDYLDRPGVSARAVARRLGCSARTVVRRRTARRRQEG